MSDFDDIDVQVFEPGDRVWTQKANGVMRAVVVKDDGGPFVVIRALDTNRSSEFTVRREKVGLG